MTGYKVFVPYLTSSNLIHRIYWDNRAPSFTAKRPLIMQSSRFTTIADITCDIAPEASIPLTIRPSGLGMVYMGKS